jgi:hypothetical protein
MLLGIIQDSVKDWKAESAIMGSIYSHGFLNIAADGFADGSQGLFRERDVTLLSPIKVVIEENVCMHIIGGDTAPIKQGNYFLVDVHSWKDEIDDAPLGRRGWVIQERALSLRTLHFGRSQIFWECIDLKANEMFSRGFVAGTVMKRVKDFATLNTQENTESLENLRTLKENHEIMRKLRLHPDMARHTARYSDILTLEEMGGSWEDLIGIDPELLNELPLKDSDAIKKKLNNWNLMNSPDNLRPPPVKHMTQAQRKWCVAIEAYSNCALSFSKDKLVAISGMASRMSGEMRCQYLAGMWRKDLEHQLLWKVSNALPAIREDGTRGPSWSWASVDGAIAFDYWHGFFYIG